MAMHPGEYKVMKAVLSHGNKWQRFVSGWMVFSTTITSQILNRVKDRSGWAEEVWEDGIKTYKITPKGIERVAQEDKEREHLAAIKEVELKKKREARKKLKRKTSTKKRANISIEK